MKKIPMRRCIVTGEMLPKNDLLRIVRTPEGDVVPDVTGKVNGHGAYIKKSLDTLETAQKKKLLSHALDCAISEEVFKKIKRIING